jgi:hypothetical protein
VAGRAGPGGAQIVTVTNRLVALPVVRVAGGTRVEGRLHRTAPAPMSSTRVARVRRRIAGCEATLVADGGCVRLIGLIGPWPACLRIFLFIHMPISHIMSSYNRPAMLSNRDLRSPESG